MDSKEKMFDSIKQLVANMPLTPDKISKLVTGINFFDKSNLNKSFSTYVFDGDHSLFRKIEIRISGNPPNTTALSIFTLSDSVEIHEEDVFGTFGKNVEFDVPPPQVPMNEPLYYTYRLKAGSVNFGISRDEKKNLMAIIIDEDDR